MRQTSWIRLGAAVVATGALFAGAMAGGCSSSSNPVNPGTDSGADHYVNTAGGGGGGTAGGGGGGTAGGGGGTAGGGGGGTDGGDAGSNYPKLIAVNASPDFGGVRFCYGLVIGSNIAVNPSNADPDTQTGVPTGTGGVLPAAPVDVSTITLAIFVLKTSSISNFYADASTNPDGGEPNCGALIGQTGKGTGDSPPGLLTLNTDFFALQTLNAGTFSDGVTTIVAITGCTPNDTTNAAICGSDYNATNGNLKVTTLNLDTTTTQAATNFGAQGAHLSQPLDAILTAVDAGPVSTGFVCLSDGGPVPDSGVTLAAAQTFGTILPATAAAETFCNSDPTQMAFVLSTPAGPAAFPFPDIQLLTVQNQTAGYFANGANYTFVIVGNPEVANFDDAGNFNTSSLHVLGFPSNPPLP